MGHVFVADCYNDRIVCWSKGSREGRIIVGGNGQGQKANQFNYPDGLSFDRQGNLYVVDWGNNRVQKFDICLD
jgi:sugar lactone lactonase YvrE